ncbi:hypothetical protein H9P43_008952 [Blastocladiella emersonii ATCC 22665]|nr:hypothetical protein H9P43_008952 [Blastocladiella emersonii ATCC 22665]
MNSAASANRARGTRRSLRAAASAAPDSASGSSSASSASDSGTSSGSDSGSDSDAATAPPAKSASQPRRKPASPAPAAAPFGGSGSLLDTYLNFTASNGSADAAAVAAVPAPIPHAVLLEPEDEPAAAAAPANGEVLIHTKPKKAEKAKKAKKDKKHKKAEPNHTEPAPSPSSAAPAPAAAPVPAQLSIPLPGTLPVAALLAALAPAAGWSDNDVALDRAVLARARIRTVADLRFLPKKAWDRGVGGDTASALPVPAVVTERLRICVWAGMDKRAVRTMHNDLVQSVVNGIAPTAAPVVAAPVAPARVVPVALPVAPPAAPTAAAAPVAPAAGASSAGTDWAALAQSLLGTSPTSGTPDYMSRTAPAAAAAPLKLDASAVGTSALISALLFDGGSGPKWVPPTLDEVMRKEEPVAAPADTVPPPQEEKKLQPELSLATLSASEMVHALLHTDAMNASAATTTDAALPDTAAGAAKSKPVPPPSVLGLVPGNPNRVRVSDGNRVYEADRYCPHKRYDMLKGDVRGSLFNCPKHNWDFDLARGGACVGRAGKSLNCAVAADW